MRLRVLLSESSRWHDMHSWVILVTREWGRGLEVELRNQRCHLPHLQVQWWKERERSNFLRGLQGKQYLEGDQGGKEKIQRNLEDMGDYADNWPSKRPVKSFKENRMSHEIGIGIGNWKLAIKVWGCRFPRQSWVSWPSDMMRAVLVLPSWQRR